MNPVIFDVTPLLPKKITGVGMYTYQLYKTLKAIGVDLTAVYRGTRLLKENNIASHIGSSAKPFFSFSSGFYNKGTILHGSDFKLPSSSSKFKKVLTVHDLAVYRNNLLEPSFCSDGQAKLNEELLKNPDAIIVPSEFIKGEFLTRFPKFQDKVHVIYHGCDHLQDTMISTKAGQSRVTNNPYFLYVGHVEKRKNLVSLVRAFSTFAEETPGVDLIIAGKDGFGAETIHEAIASSPMNKRIHKVGYVSEGNLKNLYANAVAFVYPSFYEGFGMPVVEAMKLGVAVITSQVGATSEIAGGFAHMIDPANPEDIYRGLHKLYHDSNYRGKVIKASAERATEFSWMKTARATAAIYESL